MHAMAIGSGRGPGEIGRRPFATRHRRDGDRSGARRRPAPCAGSRWPTVSASCGRRRWWSANPDLPVAYRTLLPVAWRRRVPLGTGTYSPSCLLWVAGVKGTPPPGTRPTTTSTSATHWDGAFRSLIHDGVRMSDPSILVTMHSVDDPTLAPAGCSYASTRWSPSPNLDGQDRLGRVNATASPARCAYPGRVTSAIPPTWRSSRCVRPARLGSSSAWSAARRSPSSHTFRQTGPFRPHNVDKPRAGFGVHRFLGHPARRRACPWCSCRASLAAERVQPVRSRSKR